MMFQQPACFICMQGAKSCRLILKDEGRYFNNRPFHGFFLLLLYPLLLEKGIFFIINFRKGDYFDRTKKYNKNL